jgi:ankyrin repeat protein
MERSSILSACLRALFLTVSLLFSTPSADDESDSLLYYLSAHGPDIELSRFIERGAPVNSRRADGLTPLLAAVQADNPSTVSILLHHGADALAADSSHCDALFWALQKGFYPVADVLLDHGLDVDRPNSQGNSPLMSAVMRGDLATANYLLGRGADRTRKSAEGLTPVKVAARNHDTAMKTLLTSYRPVERIKPDAQAAGSVATDSGRTFTDASEFLAAIQAGHRSFRSCSATGMDLKGIRLYGLDFRGANLSNCDLRGADLRYCDLSGAALRNAFLRGTDLRYAKLDNADFGNAMLTASDLREAKGLTFEQLRGARNLYKARVESDIEEVMQREFPRLFTDPGGAWRAQSSEESSPK